jgi:hypothetical protein
MICKKKQEKKDTPEVKEEEGYSIHAYMWAIWL